MTRGGQEPGQSDKAILTVREAAIPDVRLYIPVMPVDPVAGLTDVCLVLDVIEMMIVREWVVPGMRKLGRTAR
jgi:hypothetical protein